MEALFGAAILLPLICLGVMILTAVVVILALRRGTQAVSQQVQENTAVPENGSPANTRWARGDLKSTPQPEKTEEPMKACHLPPWRCAPTTGWRWYISAGQRETAARDGRFSNGLSADSF
jgi:hypothetical protein